MPKLYISRKTRQALLDMGFPIQSINNWRSGRYKPSRLARQMIMKIVEENSQKRRKK
jgi:DNA-binding transcriptional regulator YiaG